MNPITGICILNWNSGNRLLACIKNFHDAKSESLRIVVVDNQSHDDSFASAQRAFPGIDFIQTSANLGYARGNNVGAKHLTGLGCQYLIFLNPQRSSIDRPALAALVASLDETPDAGCAGGSPQTQSGEPQIAARTRPTLFQEIIGYGPLRNIGPLERFCRGHWLYANDLDHNARVYAVSGACIAFKTDEFNAIGGFDEATFLYYEEYIIAERLLQNGKTVVFSRHASYFHAEGASTSRIPYKRRLYFYQSENYVLRRYYRYNPLLCAAIRLYRYIEWLASLPFLRRTSMLSDRE